MINRITTLILFILTVANSYAQEDETPNPNVKEIIFVFKTHFDNGYTDKAESVIHKYATSMMEEALTTLEKSRNMPKEKHFVWTLPSWPVTQILKRCDPGMRDPIEKAFEEGWFTFHALPLTFETEASDLETLVRSLTFASDLSKKFNLPFPRDAKLTDVPSHSWVLPTLLDKAGVKILHIGCNSASRSPEVPLLFWWQGPDNSKLMTMYWGKNYGTSIVPPKEWKYKTWLAIVHTSDNQGPPSPEAVEKVLKKAKELAPNAKLRIGNISDFYDALMNEKPELPVVKGDMPDTWIHGYMSMPKEIKIARNLRKSIYSLEQLNFLCNLWSDDHVDLTPIIASANENAVLFDEHTFGMSMAHGHSGHWCYEDEFKDLRAEEVFKPLEDSWKEKGDRIYQAEKIIVPAYDREMKRISKMVNVDGRRIVVYNPLPWERTGLVTILAYNNIKSVKDLETGEILSVNSKDNVLRMIAKDVPPMGYRTYIPVDELIKEKESRTSLIVDKGNNTIENDFFRLKIDPEKGIVASLTDKKTGREMVDNNSEYGFGQYMYERFGKKEVDRYVDQYVKQIASWSVSNLGRPNLPDSSLYKCIKGGKATVNFSINNISVKALLKFSTDNGNPHNYSISYTLYNDLPFVEMNWFINGKPADSWPEAGWISFPFNVKTPDFRVGRLGAVVDPKKDFIKGSNFDYYFSNTGVAIFNQQNSGYGLCSPDAPGMSIDRPGLWRYSGVFIPSKSNVFVNLYNNQWSTNYSGWIEGSWSAKVYLWSVRNYDNEQSIISPSEEFRQGLRGCIISSKPGNLPVVKKGISLSRKGILITAFGSNPFGEGTIIRLWEQAGTSGKCEISLPEGAHFTKAIPCDLRSQINGNTIYLKDNAFEIVLGAYEPVTFLLE